MALVTCPGPQKLSAYLLGDLSEPELSEVAAHLDSCADCAAEADRLEGMDDTVLAELRRIPARRPTPAVQSTETEVLGPGGAATGGAKPEQWGDFRIAREIGRGGMGVVYEAFQGSLNRHVALKFLPEHGDLARFHREARAAGRLHHTNIVPVFGVGEHGGRHYYVMQFIDGESLDRRLRRHRRGAGEEPAVPPGAGLPPREAARIGVQVAEALAYAHEQGVIHRDVKPSNVLIDAQGTAWITDFGLARDAADDATLTHTGDLIGTLRYMAPERIAGRGDARADIYGLGATLYELICGRPAFDAADRASLLNQLLHHDPPRPRQFDPSIPRDLETIVLKAMAREPDRRYATAAEAAEDLRRFLEDRPILSRRAGAWEQVARWSRRNPAVAGLLAALLIVFLAGFAGVTIQWRRADAEAARANRTALAEAEARAAESALRIRAQADSADRSFEHGLELAGCGDVDEGLLWIAEALAQSPAERPAFARMARANLAAWERQVYPLQAILPHARSVTGIAFLPDGRRVLTGSLDGTARIWDATTGQALGPPLDHRRPVWGVASSRDGREVFTGGDDGLVRSWDAGTGQPGGLTLTHGGTLRHIGIAPVGRLLATFSDTDPNLRMWDLDTGRLRWGPVGDGKVRGLAFSPDGRWLLTGGMDGVARRWDVASGAPVGPPLRHGFSVVAAISPDGRLIATGDHEGEVRVWDAASGRTTATGRPVGSGIHEILFSPDGRLLLTAHGQEISQLWDAVTARPVGPPMGPKAPGRLSFSPDGRRLLIPSNLEHAVRIWDVATSQPIGSPLRHQPGRNVARFSPDGRLVATAGKGGTARIWDVGEVDAVPSVETSGEPAGTADRTAWPRSGRRFTRAIFAPDRSRIVLCGEGVVRSIEAASGQAIGPPMRHRWPIISAMALSPDGRRLATASRDEGYSKGGSTGMTCQVWDASSGRPLSLLLPHINWVAALAFRPDGKVLATGDYSGAVHLWNAETGERRRPPLAAGSVVLCLAFSPDGRSLAAGTSNPANHVILWDLEAGARPAEPIRFGNWFTRLAFSPDGRSLAAGSNDGTVRLADTAIGREALRTSRLDLPVWGLAFSPDGRLILAVNGGHSGTAAARVWDVRTGRPASPPLKHPVAITADAVAFSPDGTALATGCDDGSVRLWDIATSRPIGPGGRLRSRILGVAFRRDGRSLLAVDNRGRVGTWPMLEPWDEPVEQVVRRVQVRAGLRLDASRQIEGLDPDTWQALRSGSGAATPSTRGPTDGLDWHEASARDAEALGQSFAATWNLDRMIAGRPGDGLLHARRAAAALSSGDVAAARAGFARAVASGPRDRILDWLLHRAEDSRADGRPDDALLLLDQVTAERPDDWLAYAARAEVLAGLGRADDREAALARAIERGADIPFLIRLAAERSRAGRWVEAVALYDRAIAMGTVPYEVWWQAAIAHLEIEDETGFRRVGEALRSRHPADIAEALVRERLAEVLSLGPPGAGGEDRALAWIETVPAALDAARQNHRRDCLRILGSVLYRRGHFAEAIERIREAIAASPGELTHEESLFLAMAHFRIGDRAKARAILAAMKSSHPPDGPSSEAWWRAQACRLLSREASRLILDGDFPADPFAS